MLNVLLPVVLGACGSFALWILIIRPGIRKYAAKSWLDRLTEPDADTQAALFALFDQTLLWATTHKVKMDDGTEAFPIQLIGQSISSYVLARVKGMRGGLTTQGNAALGKELAGSELAPLFDLTGPRKGQSTAEWVIEQALMKALQPGGWAEQKLKSVVEHKGEGGGW